MTESQEKPLATWLMENIVKGDPERSGVEGTFAPPPPPQQREREREREREGAGRSSVPLLSISAFMHSPVKCNKS
jgi:hypothetical protein